MNRLLDSEIDFQESRGSYRDTIALDEAEYEKKAVQSDGDRWKRQRRKLPVLQTQPLPELPPVDAESLRAALTKEWGDTATQAQSVFTTLQDSIRILSDISAPDETRLDAARAAMATIEKLGLQPSDVGKDYSKIFDVRIETALGVASSHATSIDPSKMATQIYALFDEAQGVARTAQSQRVNLNVDRKTLQQLTGSPMLAFYQWGAAMFSSPVAGRDAITRLEVTSMLREKGFGSSLSGDPTRDAAVLKSLFERRARAAYTPVLRAA